MVVDRPKDRVPVGGFQRQVQPQQTTGSGDQDTHIIYSSA